MPTIVSIEPAPGADADRHLGPDPQPPQPVRQPVRPRVQLRHTSTSARRSRRRPRRGVRSAWRLEAARCTHAAVGDRHVGPFQPAQFRAARASVRSGKSADRPVGVGRDGLEQRAVVAEEPVDRRGVEQVGVVLARDGEAAAVLGHLRRSGRTAATGASSASDSTGRPPSSIRGPSPRRTNEREPLVVEPLRLLEDEHHLEDRRPARVAHVPASARPSAANGIVLVLEAVEHGRADPVEERRERSTPGRPGRGAASVLTK